MIKLEQKSAIIHNFSVAILSVCSIVAAIYVWWFFDGPKRTLERAADKAFVVRLNTEYKVDVVKCHGNGTCTVVVLVSAIHRNASKDRIYIDNGAARLMKADYDAVEVMKRGSVPVRPPEMKEKGEKDSSVPAVWLEIGRQQIRTKTTQFFGEAPIEGESRGVTSLGLGELKENGSAQTSFQFLVNVQPYSMLAAYVEFKYSKGTETTKVASSSQMVIGCLKGHQCEKQ